MLIKQRAWKNRPTCPDQTRLNPVNVLSKANPIVMGSDMLVYFDILSVCLANLGVYSTWLIKLIQKLINAAPSLVSIDLFFIQTQTGKLYLTSTFS